MEWILGFGFLLMTCLCVYAVNIVSDLRLEIKLLQQELNWCKEGRFKARKYKAEPPKE